MKKIISFFAFLFLLSTLGFSATGWYNDYVKINVNGNGTAGPTGYYWIGSDPSYGTQLQGTDLGTVTSLVIDGADMKYWSDNQDRTGGSFFYKIMSSDGSTTIVSTVETVWSHASIGGNDYQGTVSTTINLLATLKPGTTYKLHVWAKSWGSSQGDSWLSNSGNNYVATFTTSNVMIFGSNTITDGSGYSTLKGAFDALNGVSDQTGKNIEVKIGASTTETAACSLSQPTTSWTTLKIYPTASSLTVSGNITAGGALIVLNGADNVTIDGRVDMAGTTKSLTIDNTAATTNDVNTIRFINDATNNTVNYCIIKGKNSAGSHSSGGTAGVILIGQSTGTTGNDNVVISNCNIDCQGQAKMGVVSIGTSGARNTYVRVSKSNIYDFYVSNTSTTNTAGVVFGSQSDSCTADSNSFYQTVSREYATTSTVNHYVILINNGNAGFQILDNYIGGREPLCAGSAWTATQSGSTTNTGYRLWVIDFETAQTGTSSVQGNIIRNFNISTNLNSAGSTAVAAILVQSASANIGNVRGNIIGDSTGTGSILVNINNTSGTQATSLVVGIATTSTGANTYNISNNKIGSIRVTAATSTYFYHLYPISIGGGTHTINNNTIGSPSSANSIENASGSGLSGTQQYNIHCIRYAPGGTGVISSGAITNNRIANISMNSASVARPVVNGIYTANGPSSGVTTATITGNTIFNLKNTGGNNQTGTLIAVAGIMNTSTGAGQSVSSNTIYNLEATHGANAVLAGGIYYTGATTGTNVVEKNKIYNISLSTSSTAHTVPAIYGIMVAGGATTYSNNMISLGLKTDGSSITTGYPMSAFYEFLGTNNVYFNTLLMSGDNVVSSGATFAFDGRQTTNTRSFRNNIFVNARSNASGTGKNYAVRVGGSAPNPSGLTIDYNNYYTSGTGGVFGYFNAADVADLAAWKTAVGQDANSKNAAVTFVSNTNLHLDGASVGDAANLEGTSISGITTDIDGDTRGSFPYKGADEGTAPLPVTLSRVSVSVTDRNAHISWRAETELNLNKYIVERKQNDGYKASWTEVGERSGNSNSNSAKDYSFVDRNLNTGKYIYRLKMLDNDGSFEYSPEVKVEIGKPNVTDLKQNYPNSFNPSTKIEYQLANPSKVRIDLYNIAGQYITSLVNEDSEAGYFVYLFDANRVSNGLSSGMYLYRMTSFDKVTNEKFSFTKKMIYLK